MINSCKSIEQVIVAKYTSEELFKYISKMSNIQQRASLDLDLLNRINERRVNCGLDTYPNLSSCVFVAYHETLCNLLKTTNVFFCPTSVSQVYFFKTTCETKKCSFSNDCCKGVYVFWCTPEDMSMCFECIFCEKHFLDLRKNLNFSYSYGSREPGENICTKF